MADLFIEEITEHEIVSQQIYSEIAIQLKIASEIALKSWIFPFFHQKH